jgi:predicted DNA-binding ribbon-helix-helix protein
MASAPPDGLAAPNEDSESHSALVVRNVSVRGHRTSIRLEPQIWDTLAEICRREFCTAHDVCSHVAGRRPPNSSLASSLRVFILRYFHTSATEDGHSRAGHGQGMFQSEQLERKQMRAVKADAMDPECPDGSDRNPQLARSGHGPA